MSVHDKLRGDVQQRKLLALDGGGIRGMITIEILRGIESILREQSGNAKLLLADYFDYIGGTSTGAIIACCLSLGMDVDTLRAFYLESGKEMFVKERLLKRLKRFYSGEPLAEKLRSTIAQYCNGNRDATLGDSGLKTLLMMVLRNATTDSPWPVSNNPHAKYNCPLDRPGCNLNLPLWQLVRASTAAPVYFPPEVVEIGAKPFVFVDGGITMYNNPAFQLFLMATAEPYRLQWKASADKMLLVSIGTGTVPAGNSSVDPDAYHLLYNVGAIPGALMNAALHEQDLLCRVFGECVAGDEIDGELGTLMSGDDRGMAGPAPNKLFRYMRYNAELTSQGLAELGLSDINAADVQKLDSVAHVQDLARIGQAVVRRRVDASSFQGFS